jgi:hypothetical protein
MRAFSMLAGMVAAALVYRIAVDATRRPFAGAAAALIFASMGFTQYFVHEVHNYALLLAMSMAFVLFYTRWWFGSRQRAAALGAILATAGLAYTHYYGIFVIAAATLCSLAMIGRRRGDVFRWFRLQAIAAVLYLPWLPAMAAIANERLTSSANGGARRITSSAPTSFATIADTIRVMLYNQQIVYGVLILIGAVGLFLLIRREGSRLNTRLLQTSGLLIGLIAGSMGLALLVNLRYETFINRRMIFLLPMLAGVLGIGLSTLPKAWMRWLILLAATPLIVTAGRPVELPGDWAFRQAVEVVAAQVEINDLVVLQFSEDPFIGRPLRYYAHQLLPGDNPILLLGDQSLANDFNREFFATQIAANYTDMRERFWVIRSTEPSLGQTDVSWVKFLSDRAFTEIENVQSGWMTVSLFAAPLEQRGSLPGASELPDAPSLPQPFGDQFRLDRVQIDRLQAAPGEAITIWLDWRAESPPDQDTVVFVHLLTPGGQLVSQVDETPSFLEKRVRTVFWPVFTPIYDSHVLPIVPGTPPGDYRLTVGMYTSVGLTPIPITLSDGLTVNELRITTITITQ